LIYQAIPSSIARAVTSGVRFALVAPFGATNLADSWSIMYAGRFAFPHMCARITESGQTAGRIGSVFCAPAPARNHSMTARSVAGYGLCEECKE
jgi:hypothetical protein